MCASACYCGDRAPVLDDAADVIAHDRRPEYRTSVGRVCKWIIDGGRVAYLRSVGYAVPSLLSYCPREDSLEDGLLLGVRGK